MDAILTCDRSTHGGRRDHILLLTLYNTGARVSEIVALRRSHVRFGAATVVQLLGKGRKERAVPLWTRTGRCLRQWFDEEGEATPDYAFRNARGDRLTRQGVTHLLDQACQRARQRWERVSPHVIRHTTARSHCDIVSSRPPITTEADLEGTRPTETIRSVNEPSGSRPSSLLNFLASL